MRADLGFARDFVLRRFLAVNDGVLMFSEGVWAEVKIAGEHLRLFSEQSPPGFQASVYKRQVEELDHTVRACRPR